MEKKAVAQKSQWRTKRERIFEIVFTRSSTLAPTPWEWVLHPEAPCAPTFFSRFETKRGSCSATPAFRLEPSSNFPRTFDYWPSLFAGASSLIEFALMCQCVDIDFGTYANTVSMKTPNAILVDIDTCIASEIGYLWHHGITTLGSCCGHNKLPPSVVVTKKDIPRMLSLSYVPVSFQCVFPQRTFTLKHIFSIT